MLTIKWIQLISGEMFLVRTRQIYAPIAGSIASKFNAVIAKNRLQKKISYPELRLIIELKLLHSLNQFL